MTDLPVNPPEESSLDSPPAADSAQADTARTEGAIAEPQGEKPEQGDTAADVGHALDQEQPGPDDVEYDDQGRPLAGVTPDSAQAWQKRQAEGISAVPAGPRGETVDAEEPQGDSQRRLMRTVLHDHKEYPKGSIVDITDWDEDAVRQLEESGAIERGRGQGAEGAPADIAPGVGESISEPAQGESITRSGE